MKVGRVPSLEDFLQEFWRDLVELLLQGGFLSVVAHFSRATLSSESARNSIVTCIKLEMSAVLYFNCRSISVTITSQENTSKISDNESRGNLNLNHIN